MISNTETEPITSVESGTKLILRLSNLKVLTLSNHKNLKNLTYIDLRNNRLA
jgi:Leucine-rich repeat (LRR) protein